MYATHFALHDMSANALAVVLIKQEITSIVYTIQTPKTPPPTDAPSVSPTKFPSVSPSRSPVLPEPSASPSRFPTKSPTVPAPTSSPTTAHPTTSPTQYFPYDYVELSSGSSLSAGNPHAHVLRGQSNRVENHETANNDPIGGRYYMYGLDIDGDYNYYTGGGDPFDNGVWTENVAMVFRI